MRKKIKTWKSNKILSEHIKVKDKIAILWQKLTNEEKNDLIMTI